jgi:hypothetical protein
MRGCAENRARSFGPPRQAQPAAIERNSLDLGTRRLERYTCAAISRALDPRQITLVQDHPRDQFNRRLGRRRDDQPPRIGLDAAMLHEMAEQRRAKRRMIGPDSRRMPAAGGTAQTARPHFVWKLAGIGEPRSKRPRNPSFVREVPARPTDLSRPAGDPHEAGRLMIQRLISGDQLHFLDRRNHRPASACDDNVTFHRQLIDDGGDRVSRDGKIFRQHPAGRQPVSPRQRARKDCGAQAIVDLARQAAAILRDELQIDRSREQAGQNWLHDFPENGPINRASQGYGLCGPIRQQGSSCRPICRAAAHSCCSR